MWETAWLQTSSDLMCPLVLSFFKGGKWSYQTNEFRTQIYRQSPVRFYVWWFNRTLSIYNRGRYSISNINQQLTICQQIWCLHLFLIWNVVKKIGAFKIYSLSFNLAGFNWPEEQSTSIRYLWSRQIFGTKKKKFQHTQNALDEQDLKSGVWIMMKKYLYWDN